MQASRAIEAGDASRRARRRRRVDEPRAVGAAQARARVPARPRDAALDHARLADGQPRDARPVDDLARRERREARRACYEISREAQDEFALRSHQRAAARLGRRASTTARSCRCPDTELERDESDPARHLAGEARQAQAGVRRGRHGHRRQRLAAQRRRRRRCCSATRRARADARARAAGADRRPRRAHGVDPDVFGIAPVEAANRALARAGIGWDDVDVVELNEAFASQSLACLASGRSSTPRRSTRTAARSRSGTRSGASGVRILGGLAHELQPARRRATASPPSASASARGWRSYWRHDMSVRATARPILADATGRDATDAHPPLRLRGLQLDARCATPSEPLMSLPQTLTEITGPQLGEDRRRRARPRPHPPARGRAASASASSSAAACSTPTASRSARHAGRGLAGQRRRPLPARRRPAGRRRSTRTSPAPGAA